MIGRWFGSRLLLCLVFGDLLLWVLSGCAVGPDYHRVDPTVPAKWSQALPGHDLAGGASELVQWWRAFRDAELDFLVERAIQSNLDLKLAGARIREARAQRGVVAAGAYPQLNTSGSFARSRPSANASSPASAVEDLNFYQAGFDARWEIDIFGGVRRAVEAANAQIDSSEENRRDVLVSLLAEVARNYVQVRGSQLRISLANHNFETQRQTLELAKARFEAGLSSELDVAQAKASLATTEAQIPSLEASLKQAIHQLGVLLGQEPGALIEELSKVQPIPSPPPEIPLGIPSELLRRRPDLRRAERDLAAATAQIGVATADLFPKFSLTGAAGLESVGVADFLTSGSRFWSIGPTIRWPIFDAGRIRANIEVQNARQEQALVQYEKVVLTSLADVENALVAYAKEQATRSSLAQAVEANQRAVDISSELYARGLVDFLNVLVNQRALYQLQDQLAQSDQNLSTDLVALYKALGGGWKVPAD